MTDLQQHVSHLQSQVQSKSKQLSLTNDIINRQRNAENEAELDKFDEEIDNPELGNTQLSPSKILIYLLLHWKMKQPKILSDMPIVSLHSRKFKYSVIRQRIWSLNAC